MISRKAYGKLKNIFQENKRKHNVSLSLYHETNTKTLENILVDNKLEYFYEYELKKLLKPSADPQYKDLKYTYNSTNAFLVLLVICFEGQYSTS